jgi:hypothetical protein
MPVEKFRSIDEMNAAPVRDARGNRFERFLRHCSRFWKLAPRAYPRGVVKFRSFEEAQATRADISEV